MGKNKNLKQNYFDRNMTSVPAYHLIILNMLIKHPVVEIMYCITIMHFCASIVAAHNYIELSLEG